MPTAVPITKASLVRRRAPREVPRPVAIAALLAAALILGCGGYVALGPGATIAAPAARAEPAQLPVADDANPATQV